MIGVIIVGLVGIVLVSIGYLVGKRKKISLFHDYHYENVSEKDKDDFCTLSGTGILVIGISLLITALILCISNSAWSFMVFAAGFVAGIVLLVYAGNRYNKQ